MGYILLGHGWMDVDPALTPPEMELVAIPPGTTIQFYSDAGQGLVYDHEELDLWEQLRPPWPPLDSRHVTYNLTLHSALEYMADDLVNDPQFGGHQLIIPGSFGIPDPIRLCTGTPATCPTDPRAVLVLGATHDCEGLLGRGDLSGDLFWLACTKFEGATVAERRTIDGLRAGRPTNVVLGDDPDWVPCQADLTAIDDVNRAQLEGACDGERLHYVLGSSVFLIGQGHDPRYMRFARYQEHSVRNVLVVHKGAGAQRVPGFSVWGLPPQLRALVRSSFARISDRKVRFR